MPIYTCTLGYKCDCRNKLVRTEVIMDSGASDTFCNNRASFVTYEPIDAPVEGFTGNSRIKGRGMVVWYMHDEEGTLRELRTPALHVPDGKKNLFSPQRYFLYREKDMGEDHPGKLTIRGRWFEFTDETLTPRLTCGQTYLSYRSMRLQEIIGW